ncbi:hypothetical protein EV196_102319 [Mariniflexile fucanivorans]|uniref:Uncharacterized protein n=1 Tax=Mariniflexile fucanivorans TaxID=264023 RepID=A0A4R1RN84_9FLAO|nr:hypothetical protein [Mariniflexile fucanivorans]TCL67758.1 hypothetical protein EV196_102319 [Mariniflexile fucanivorans]
MKTNYLLPNKYKAFGWLLFLSGIILGIFLQVFDSTDDLFNIDIINNFGYEFLDEIISVLIVIGGLLVGFSKEKTEDEFIHKLRHESLVWAIILNYIILLFTIIFIYEANFFTVLVYNMFTPLIFFIVRFNFLKLKLNSDEE